ncbi:iron-containing alcohol dehydrogenase [Brevibacillus choshinensis]|uniref:iron-containing alcohol dehydrogenase n=1 Tax=Brevibacillus choshinensis TaxID=54911 RepID=UPI002ECB18F0|nr:iron-containing alcohol dehydrogenase [Brevibacillus choshinensis]MED4779682.1 iron-containing alcohol dehydrogenase [Brevibacillus choshinensis]
MYDQVKPYPRDVDCMETYRLAKDAGVNLLNGLGGGSSMDTAKGGGTFLSHGGDIRNWYGTDALALYEIDLIVK